MRELGKAIKQKRGKLDWSQAELAKQAGISRGQVSNYEHGKVDEPPAETVTALAMALGEDPEKYLKMSGHLLMAAEGVAPVSAPKDSDVVAAIRALEEQVRLLRVAQEATTTTLAELLGDAFPAPEDTQASDGRPDSAGTHRRGRG